MIVGQAASVGLAIEILIFVRSLTDSLMWTKKESLPLVFHESLLAALDNGIDPTEPCALVDNYACDWWNADAEPDADQIMGLGNLFQLLNCHAEQHTMVNVPHLRAFPKTDPTMGNPDCAKCQG
jgi:hypothetical protein